MARKLSDWFTAYLALTENTEPSKLYREWAAIYAMSAVLQRKCYLRWDKETYPNMYIVLIGPSGARKGTAMEPAIELLRKVQISLSPDKVTVEQLIAILAKPEAQQQIIFAPKLGAPSRTLFTTPLALIAPELTVLLGYQERNTLAILNAWFDCLSPWSYSTKHQGEYEVIGMYISLFGATTPALLQSCLPPTDLLEGGFSSRTIFVYAQDREKIVICPVRTAAENELFTKLHHDLDDMKCMKGEYTYTENWFLRYAQWYKTEAPLITFPVPHLDKYLQRRQTHLLKLCMIFNASRGGDFQLEVQDFDRANELLLRTEAVMHRSFAGMGKAKDADVLQRVMTHLGIYKKVSLQELMRIFYYDVSKEGMVNILATLQTMNAVRVTSNGTSSYVEWTDNVKQ